MRLHEAMLKGREMFPEARHNTESKFIIVKDGVVVEFCALGAAYLAVEGSAELKNVDGEFGDYAKLGENFPELHEYGGIDLLSYIWELNDRDKLSIEEIAEKVKDIYE